jgi:outer membrane protein OmpA-like peptidoglycan-associated protein
MRRRWITSGTIGLVSILAMGCQDKVLEENRALHEQNVELQAQLDEAHRQRQAEPAPAPVVVAPAPAPVVVPPPPPAPAPKPDLGTLVVTEDKAAGTTTVSLPGDVFFDSGHDIIKESAKASLDKVVLALKREYRGKTVRVEGYTDTDPILHSHWASNQELSEARAKAVGKYLIAHGIDASRVTTSGFGDTKPKATKALSRRVEVVVITG